MFITKKRVKTLRELRYKCITKVQSKVRSWWMRKQFYLELREFIDTRNKAYLFLTTEEYMEGVAAEVFKVFSLQVLINVKLKLHVRHSMARRIQAKWRAYKTNWYNFR
jgi:hypothetical protein